MPTQQEIQDYILELLATSDESLSESLYKALVSELTEVFGLNQKQAKREVSNALKSLYSDDMIGA